MYCVCIALYCVGLGDPCSALWCIILHHSPCIMASTCLNIALHCVGVCDPSPAKWCIALHYIAYVGLHCVATSYVHSESRCNMACIALHCVGLGDTCSTLCCNILDYSVQYGLHCIALHCIALHRMELCVGLCDPPSLSLSGWRLPGFRLHSIVPATNPLLTISPLKI